MVERKVGINLDFMPGIAQLRLQAQGIVQLSQSALLRIQHAEEQHALRMKLMKQKLHDVENQLLVSDVEQHRKSVKAIETEEERHNLRMRQLRERMLLQAQRDKAAFEASQRFGFSQAGHIAQSLGFYRAGHLLRAAGGGGGGGLLGSALGTRIGMRAGAKGAGEAGAAEAGAAEGAAAEGAGAAAAGGMGLGAVAAAALPVAIALGAVYAAGKLVEVGFNAMAATAQSFVAGVAQIGGAKSLQEMVVGSAEAQRAGKLARLTVPEGERLKGDALDELASSLAREPELGGFDRTKWIAAINEMGTVTGHQKSIDRQSWEFMGRMANIGGTDPSEVAKVYGTLAYANPQLSNKNVQELLLSGIGIGRELTFNVGELPTAGRVLQSGFKIGGDRMSALKTSMALAGLIKPFTPSGTLGEAGTMEEALFREMTRVGIRGEGPVKVNKMGQITNLNKALGWTLSTPEAQLPKALLERESGEAIHALKAKFGIEEKDTPQQVQKRVDDMLAHLTSLGLSMGEFAKESEEATGASQRIKARFNELTDALEERLIKLLESDEFQKAFQNIIDFLQANAPTLELALEEMITVFNILAPAAWSLTETFIDIMNTLMKQSPILAMMMPDLAKGIDNLSKSFTEAKNQHELREKFMNAVYPADFIGPLPPGAHKAKPEEVSVPVVHRPADTKLDTANSHLNDMKTIQQRTHDILVSIDKNIKEGGGKGFVPPPPRSHDGQ